MTMKEEYTMNNRTGLIFRALALSLLGFATSIFAIMTTLALADVSPAPTPAATPSPLHAPKPQIPVIIPNPPGIDAKGYVLMDANSGAVIASKNMNERLEPA